MEMGSGITTPSFLVFADLLNLSSRLLDGFANWRKPSPDFAVDSNPMASFVRDGWTLAASLASVVRRPFTGRRLSGTLLLETSSYKVT